MKASFVEGSSKASVTGVVALVLPSICVCLSVSSQPNYEYFVSILQLADRHCVIDSLLERSYL